MNHKRFNRHEVFEMSDTSFILDCISKVKSFVRTEDGTAELTNMLYGLFDGYYYDKIHQYAALYLPIEMFVQLEDILAKIDDSLIHVASYRN